MMLHSTANSITNLFVENSIIKEQDREVYVYGLEYILAFSLSALVVLTSSFLLGKFFETITFVFVIYIMRAFAGGYHADTHLKCQALFFFMSFLNIFLSKITNLYSGIHLEITMIVLLCISSVLVFILAPVAHENRPLTTKEYDIFKVKSRIAALFITTVILLACFVFKNGLAIYFSGTMGLFASVISLILARMGGEKNEIQ